MELTPKLNEKVMAAVQQALKEVKPRPAIDRIVAMRTTGKWAHYVQILTSYGPKQFGVIYVGLPECKVTVHDAAARSSKIWASRELRRITRQEAKLKKEQAKAAKAEPKTEKIKATVKRGGKVPAAVKSTELVNA